MSVHVLADGRDGGPVGVLVDDPRCGRVLLDCGVGVAARAAFAGLSLAGARVLCSGAGPLRLDPSVPPSVLVDAHDVVGALALDAGPGETAFLLDTTSGILFHCPSPGALPIATVAALPATTLSTLPLRPRPELCGVDVRALPTGRRLLVTGGARSGKSAMAERLLSGRQDVDYLATGPVPAPDDAEWQTRVQTHQERRPRHWRTIESIDAAGVLGLDAAAPMLLDGVGTWLAATMDAADVWAGHGDDALATALDTLVDAWRTTGREVVAVTDEVGSGVVPATPAGRRFRDELGRLNARLAEAADEVWLCTAGIGQRLR